MKAKPEEPMTKLALTALTISFAATAGHALDWPQWRGPSGNGVSAEKGLPVTWTNDKNIAWRAKLEGQGVSSPIVSGDQVIITSQVGRGDFAPATIRCSDSVAIPANVRSPRPRPTRSRSLWSRTASRTESGCGSTG